MGAARPNWRIPVLIAAGLLFVAGVMKISQSMIVPGAPWAMIGVVEVAWALTLVWTARWGPSRLITGLLFFLLFGTALARVLAGESSCGCFGSWHVPPIVMTGLDAVVAGWLVAGSGTAVSMRWRAPVLTVCIVVLAGFGLWVGGQSGIGHGRGTPLVSAVETEVDAQGHIQNAPLAVVLALQPACLVCRDQLELWRDWCREQGAVLLVFQPGRRILVSGSGAMDLSAEGGPDRDWNWFESPRWWLYVSGRRVDRGRQFLAGELQ